MLRFHFEGPHTDRHIKITRAAIKYADNYQQKYIAIDHDVDCVFDINDDIAGHGACIGDKCLHIHLPSTTVHNITDDDLVFYIASVIVHELFHAQHTSTTDCWHRSLFQWLCEEGLACYHEVYFLGSHNPILYQLRKAGLRLSQDEAAAIYNELSSYVFSKTEREILDAAFLTPGVADENNRAPGYKLGYYFVRSYLDANQDNLPYMAQLSYSEIFKLIPKAPFESLPRE